MKFDPRSGFTITRGYVYPAGESALKLEIFPPEHKIVNWNPSSEIWRSVEGFM